MTDGHDPRKGHLPDLSLGLYSEIEDVRMTSLEQVSVRKAIFHLILTDKPTLKLSARESVCMKILEWLLEREPYRQEAADYLLEQKVIPKLVRY